MEIKIVKGNIIDAKTDAIVLPANSQLKEGKGASNAIFAAAGRKELTKACNRIGHCEIGTAVPTLGYKLAAKYIIHAVVPKWIDGEHNEYDLLSSAYTYSIELADVMGCKSIAFPLLASGHNGFDLELALEIALKSIGAYSPKQLEEVMLVIFDNSTAEMIKEKGLNVCVLPRNLYNDEIDLARKEKTTKMIQDAKGIAMDFLDEQIRKGIDYIKNPDNKEKAVKFGIEIAKMVLNR